jgi:hypothetical protein
LSGPGSSYSVGFGSSSAGSPGVSFRELVELMVDADLDRLTAAPNRLNLA